MKKYILTLCVILICLCTACGSSEESSEYSVQSDKSQLYGYSEKMIELNINPDVYTGTLWRIDNEVDTQLPRTFRTVYSEMSASNLKDEMDGDFTPSDEGLTDTKMSGSAEFDEYQISPFVTEIRKHHSGEICIVDLRQESHLYVNGRCLSWYGLRDWGNIGKDIEEIKTTEDTLASAIEGETIDAYLLDDDKQPYDQELIEVKSVQSEEDLIKDHDLSYYRLPCTDHVAPTDAEVDEFIAFTKDLDDDTWLHFHCEAGKGRTTYFMAIYDMMKNPQLPMKDILYRQCLIGGNYVAKDSEDSWKAPYYAEKAERIQMIYQYIQENYKTDYEVSLTEWNKK